MNQIAPCKYYEIVADGIWVVKSIETSPSPIEVFATPPDGGSWPDDVAYPGYTDNFACCLDGPKLCKIYLGTSLNEVPIDEELRLRVGDRFKFHGQLSSEGYYRDVEIRKITTE